MYFIDTPTMNIFKFDYDIGTGDISDKKLFFHYEGKEAQTALPLTVRVPLDSDLRRW